MADKRYIFLVDDEPIQNEMLKDYLNERFIYDIKTFDNGEEMLKNMHFNPEIVVLDYHLSAHKTDAKNGVEILKMLKDKYPQVQVGNKWRQSIRMSGFTRCLFYQENMTDFLFHTHIRELRF